MPGDASNQASVQSPGQAADWRWQSRELGTLGEVGSLAAQDSHSCRDVQGTVYSEREVVWPLDLAANLHGLVEALIWRKGAVEDGDGVGLPVREQHAVDNVTDERHRYAVAQ
jgi:hypothetical protein